MNRPITEKQRQAIRERLEGLPTVKQQQIGVVSVDTGMILLTDPSYDPIYINRELATSKKEYWQYGKGGWGSQLLIHAGDDGIYPVIGHMDKNGRINSISINFRDAEWAPESKDDYKQNPSDILYIIIPSAILLVLSLLHKR